MQKLIRANIDSYNGFHESAEELEDEQLSSLFRSIGDERSAMATELQQYVEFNGEDHIKAAYEDVLKETAGSAMNDVLTAQYAKVKVDRDKVRDLRDAYAKK